MHLALIFFREAAKSPNFAFLFKLHFVYNVHTRLKKMPIIC